MSMMSKGSTATVTRSLAEKLCIARLAEERSPKGTKLVFYFEKENPVKAEKYADLVAEFGMNILIHGGEKPFVRYNVQKDKLAEALKVLSILS